MAKRVKKMEVISETLGPPIESSLVPEDSTEFSLGLVQGVVSSPPDPAQKPERKSWLDDVDPKVPPRYGTVVSAVFELDVEETHKRLTETLEGDGPVTASGLQVALDECARHFHEAGLLSDKARADYDVYKEMVWEAWLQERRDVARDLLEKEKKEKTLTKTISVDMVNDFVRSHWHSEYEDRLRKLKEFQAAVHSLERLVEVWKQRARLLEAQKDLVVAVGGIRKS